MAVAWIVLNIIDLALTSKAMGAGAREANPFLNYLLGYNMWAFALGKMAVALGVAGIYRVFKSHRTIAYVFSAGNVLIGIVVLYELLMLV